MKDAVALETTINRLRSEMIRNYEKTGDLRNYNVIALSQELDIYLLKFQKLSDQKRQSR
ncbi:aspartyl-phosphate phosphatase Spo0E family protein [Tumebacillus lipolyticus]|uniref:Aspartyl-phosphate phosphatase Spo0E family protein n=1 Tax=Tumebacillus lipolyticus TaxID=1280370 RepID=A0ABW4ZWS6_9BACL